MKKVFVVVVRRFLLVFSLTAVLGAPLRAGAAPTAEAPARAVLPPDRSTVLPTRRPDAGRLRELARQREFRYVEARETVSIWDVFWARVWRWLGRLLSTPTGRTTWEYGWYVVALAALVFAVLKLMQVDLTGVLSRAPRRAALAYDTEGENIHEVDFPTRIAEAEAAGNYRLATRLGYLELLKRLTDQGLIRWQPDKTNHTYLAELKAGALREAFREATRRFEYVWYGELSLNATLYQQVRAGQQAVAAQVPGRGAGAHLAPNLNASAA